ncbi:hypothetical protein A3K73_05625 [Candidatus Pacearchaeota archaeon RBG_13_36_9]|nr:MAG: hypothetical protein A3K73_05625 [Candidatus Pacearchaeota archaeon RBG_13_36_9]
MEIVFVQGASNLEVSVHNNYKEVLAGNDIWFTIKIANLENIEKADISLNYWISDDNNSIIAENKETMAVQTQASFVKTFNIPEDTEPGKYKINAKVDYGDDKEVVAETSFNVVEKQIDNRMYYLIAIAAVFILVLIILIFSYKKLRVLFEKLQIKIRVGKIIEKRKLYEK